MNARTVGTVMTHNVVTARPDTAFKDMVDTMATERISALPVVDGAMRVVSIVSEADLLHKLDLPDEHVYARLLNRRRRAAATKAAGDIAGELMTTPAVTIGPEATIGSAARLMAQHRVKRLPVVDGDGRLVGIVSRRDLLATYLRPDDEIRAEVREDVMLRVLFVEPMAVTVTVTDGVVTLAGMVDRRSTAQIAGRIVRTVTGVVNLVNDLRWEYDDRDDLKRHYVFDAQVEPLARRGTLT